jgi:EAL domain-containing protein (putative c-di-GMP-specific phosphodiesterase class I)/HAMP domain-containing protein
VVTLWFLFCIARLLMPIRDVANAIDACADGQPISNIAGQQDDEIARMATNLGRIADKLAPKRKIPQEQELRRAITDKQFVLHYQPVGNLATGRLAGAEALLRWNHPERGLLYPAEFLPALEESGLIDELGSWILDEACRQARTWEESGLARFRMTINLSARQLRDPDLKTKILRALDLHHLASYNLELDLADMTEVQQASPVLAELRALGVGIATDDFANGLRNIRHLPLTKLKIDREFVSHVDTRADSQAICRALIELARDLSLDLLAEGVERREEVEMLRSLSCTQFQGFYFARAMAPDSFVATVNDPDWIALLASPVHRELIGLKNRITPQR